MTRQPPRTTRPPWAALHPSHLPAPAAAPPVRPQPGGAALPRIPPAPSSCAAAARGPYRYRPGPRAAASSPLPGSAVSRGGAVRAQAQHGGRGVACRLGGVAWRWGRGYSAGRAIRARLGVRVADGTRDHGDTHPAPRRYHSKRHFS